MKVAFGISWGRRERAAAMAITLAVASMLTITGGSTEALEDLIVRAVPGGGERAVQSVRDAGGTVGESLDLIGGFTAQVPASAVEDLARAPGIMTATLDARLRLMSHDPVTFEDDSADGYAADKDPNSMYKILKEVLRADEFWDHGYRGEGVDVALVDSGVVPVDGLTAPGAVVNGPDLSFESQFDEARYLDTFGHGTHMAGIIAGRDGALRQPVRHPDHPYFAGVAPQSRVVSVKVADVDGQTDVSQVIEAIEWVVEHGQDDGLNIRVLNLSFGTDGLQSYVVDPLTYAVEQAWREGIVVVVAAGNSNFGTRAVNNPAYDPHVIAVGAAATYGTHDVSKYTVPDWSAVGDGIRNPDLVAPGKSVVSLRAPGSGIDEYFPAGRVAERYFRGSGTSQAAAMVSGAAALILDQRPGLSPDQVKLLLKRSARKLPIATTAEQGAGVLDLERAYKAISPTAAESVQPYPYAIGGGSIDGSRGTVEVTDGTNTLDGEQDIFGATWTGSSWDAEDDGFSLDEAADGDWSGSSWAGRSWSGKSWSGKSWSGKSWSAGTWLGKSWSGKSWSGASWSGKSWAGKSWAGRSWSGKSWASEGWG